MVKGPANFLRHCGCALNLMKRCKWAENLVRYVISKRTWLECSSYRGLTVFPYQLKLGTRFKASQSAVTQCLWMPSLWQTFPLPWCFLLILRFLRSRCWSQKQDSFPSQHACSTELPISCLSYLLRDESWFLTTESSFFNVRNSAQMISTRNKLCIVAF